MAGAIPGREDFRRDGFVRFPQFLASTELETVRAELDRFVREVVPNMPASEVYYEDLRNESSIKQLQQLAVHDAYFRSIANESAFERRAADLLGCTVECQNVQYFDKPPGCNAPTPAHQDGAYFHVAPNDAVTLWLALDDVDLESGCVHYVPGSHRVDLVEHQRSGVLGFSQQIGAPIDRGRPMPCGAGDLLAHHAGTIHWGGGNRSLERHRRAIGFIYFASHSRVDGRAAA